jgi:uncharacterized protein
VAELFPRRAAELVEDALSAFRVVIVNGARQSGKSTLLETIRGRATAVTLDDRNALRAARTDPAGFLEGLGTPLYIDEVQRGGDPLVLAIKAAVDRRHTEAGLYVLAGSSRFLTVPQLSESLAGRARIIDLWPLSQSEIAGNAAETLIDRLFRGDEVRNLDTPVESRSESLERVVRGGFPTAHRISTARQRAAWFDDYVETLIRRDLTELSRIRQGVDLRRFVSLLAARTSQEVNVAAIARAAQLGEDATRSYLALIETIFLVHQLPAWSTSATARAKRRTKLHFVDSGVAANVLGVSVDSLLPAMSPYLGPLVETFVVSEFARLQTWSAHRVRHAHFRDSEQREVDLVLEARDGRVVCVEVKAANDVDEGDFRHLRYLRDRLGDRFVQGVVVHLGRRPLAFGDRLTALPLSSLWAS